MSDAPIARAPVRRDWKKFLTDWEKLQLECMATARTAIGDRYDETSKTLSARMGRIKNNACGRAKYAVGAHFSCKRKG